MSVFKRGPILILVVVLLVTLAGGGGLALLGTQTEVDRVQKEIDALNVTTSDLTNLGALTNISGKGWISAGLGSEHILSVLNGLRDHKCCTLEPDFAVPNLEALDHVQVVLSDEKTRITGMALIGDTSRLLQTSMVNAYATNEELVRNVSQVFLDWSATFGDDKRESRIKAMEDATRVGLEQYTDVQEKIDAMIGQTRSQQDSVSARLAVLKVAQNDLKVRSYISIAVLVIGVVLLLVLVITLARMRITPVPVPVTQAHTQPAMRKKLRKPDR